MALYSASDEDLDTVGCFLDFQEMRLESRKIQYPVTDHLVSRHAAQSESLKPFKTKLEKAE